VALIADRVELARAGKNPWVIHKLPSGWAVMGDVQFLPGYCLLLADPVVPSINDLSLKARSQFFQDMARIGDALLKVTPSFRINYEVLGNSEPELHAHIFPRFMSEAAEIRRKPAWFYNWETAVRYTEAEHGAIRKAMRELLQQAEA
jgi:diadenosine tetraphosphate (Ap4A) HIT family hydrolase